MRPSLGASSLLPLHTHTPPQGSRNNTITRAAWPPQLELKSIRHGGDEPAHNLDLSQTQTLCAQPLPETTGCQWAGHTWMHAGLRRAHGTGTSLSGVHKQTPIAAAETRQAKGVKRFAALCMAQTLRHRVLQR